MRRYFKYLVLVIVSIFLFDVEAMEYNTYDSIPITSTNATINTKNFTYNGVTYNKGLDDTGSTYFSFSGIVNKYKKKIPITVAIGMFDKDGKNIGTIFYCTKRDYDSKYSGLEIKPNASVSFTISAKRKYFVNGRSATEIASYSILSDNFNCDAAGFTKYKGLTITEIQEGLKPQKSSEPEKPKVNFNSNIFETASGGLMVGVAILSVVVAILFYIFYCYILNSLYKKMYNTATSLVFVPVVNTFICVRMAFGPLVAIIWGVLFGISLLISVFGLFIFTIVVSILSLVAFALCIVKLLTKNYAMMYFDPRVKNEAKKKENKKEKKDNKFVSNANSAKSMLNNKEESLLEETGADAVKIDLNYSQADVDKVSNDYFEISSGIGQTGATSVNTSNTTTPDSNLSAIVGRDLTNTKKTGGDMTTNYNTLLNLDDGDEKESEFDEDLPGDD